METTIVKIGNSLGSRYSKAYLAKIGVKEGDRVEVVIKKLKPNTAKALAALRELAKLGTFSDIKDPVAWQRAERAQWDEREQNQRDIARH